MNIGVLGSGEVATTLGSGFVKHGHQVMLGTRSPEKIADWAKVAGASAGTFDQAAAFAEIIVLAVRGLASADALRLAETKNLAGKVVIDATDPIADLPPDQNGMLQLFTGRNTSLMEQLQQEFPDARFVKAFNQVGVASMVNPHFKGGKPTMFICGNDDAAKHTVTPNPRHVRLGSS
jgi:predicted dinucleotide-binding enzyme